VIIYYCYLTILLIYYGSLSTSILKISLHLINMYFYFLYFLYIISHLNQSIQFLHRVYYIYMDLISSYLLYFAILYSMDHFISIDFDVLMVYYLDYIVDIDIFSALQEFISLKIFCNMDILLLFVMFN
jgi:hypothetical protein